MKKSIFPRRMKSETNSFYRYFFISRRDRNWGLYVTIAGLPAAPKAIEATVSVRTDRVAIANPFIQ